MQITIRNQQALRIIGFKPNSTPSRMIVSLSIRDWISTIWYRISHLGRQDEWPQRGDIA